MAEGDGAIFNNAKEQLLLGALHLTTDTIKIILVAAWTATVDGEITYTTFQGVTELTTGSGYNVGGETLSNKAVTQDDGANTAYWDNTVDITWTALNKGTPSHAVIYSDTHASKAAICYWILGRASNGSDYKVAFGSGGIIVLS